MNVINCTFYANSAGGQGGGIRNVNATGELSVRNCIFWANTDNDNVDVHITSPASSLTVTFSNVGAFDPLFADCAAGRIRPAIPIRRFDSQ